MKTAKNTRPKISDYFSRAFEKAHRNGLYKRLISLLYLVIQIGDTTQIYIVVTSKEVRKKTKKRIVELMTVVREITVFLGAFFGLIYTLRELFFK